MPPPQKPLANIPCLDGIRAMAALMVMAFHFVRPSLFGESAAKIGLLGQTGVDLFFVLSGFLITRILIATKQSPAGLREKLWVFYMRRALRIFPLYFAYLAFHFFILPAFSGAPASPWQHQIWAWTYCQNIPATFPAAGTSSGPGHFWSLAVEEHYYFIWPFLVLMCSPAAIRRVCIGVLIASPVLRYVLYGQGYEVYYFTLTRLDALAFGALMAFLTADGVHAGFHRLCRVLLLALPPAILALFVVFSGIRQPWVQAVKLSLIPCFYAALIGWCVFSPSRMANAARTAFSWPILRKIGLVGYGLYVFHPLAFHWADTYCANRGLTWHTLCAFALTFVLAIPSYILLESPILRLKRFFAYSAA